MSRQTVYNLVGNILYTNVQLFENLCNVENERGSPYTGKPVSPFWSRDYHFRV